MSWLSNLFGPAPSRPSPEAEAQAAERMAQWEQAITHNKVPDFVQARLAEAAHGKVPWMSTMTPAELLLSRSHGVRPVAMVSGTCWYHYGFSWTRGHAEGWHAAVARMKHEARAAGANAVVDVKLRTTRLPAEDGMDFTVIGTAVKIDGLPPSKDPVIATVPALEFVRLLEAGIVPVGLAVGAHYEWLLPRTANPLALGSFANQQLPEMSKFWDKVRKTAVRELHRDAGRQGDGVLAHTNFGQLLQPDEDSQQFLGRFIVIGTVVQCRRHDSVPHAVHAVIDMRDDDSPLQNAQRHGHNAYPVHNDEEGAI